MQVMIWKAFAHYFSMFQNLVQLDKKNLAYGLVEFIVDEIAQDWKDYAYTIWKNRDHIDLDLIENLLEKKQPLENFPPIRTNKHPSQGMKKKLSANIGKKYELETENPTETDVLKSA